MKAKIVIMILLVAVILACGSSSDDSYIVDYNNSLATEMSSRPYDGITFAGKVVNPETGEWENNRLVLLFLKSKEIARTTSSTTEYTGMIADTNPPPTLEPGLSIADGCTQGTLQGSICGDYPIRFDNGLGLADGVFILQIPNTYQLSGNRVGAPLTDLPFIQVREEGGTEVLGTWIDSFAEGDTREFYVPSKNLRYILKVLPGDLSLLPAEIQEPGSIALLDGNRLVAVDPNAPESTPQSAISNSQARFEQITEQITEFPATIFPLNNCGGGAEIKQEITQAYIHEIIDESNIKFGIELPLTDWLKIIFEVEKHYGISDKEITTYSTTLTVPAGQNVEYTVIRKQTWESGVAIVNDGVEISAPYRILKSETYEVTNSQQKSCQ